jgi:SRSO17 transposase
MTEQEIHALGPAFAGYLARFRPDLGDVANVAHLRDYARGLLSDLPRKSVEPIALAAGACVRSLQQFLKACDWDQAGVRDRTQRLLAAAAADRPADGVGTVGILDETSCVKKGAKTPGVQRQYLGCVGKVENGVVTVHLAAARGRFKALLDGELYLPMSWDADRPRCRAAGVPDDIRYRPMWLIGLGLVGRAGANGWAFDWLTFDEGYGARPKFLRLLDVAGQRYVGEVPKTFRVRVGRGRTRIAVRDAFARPGVKAKAARSFRAAQQTGPDAVWQVKQVKVCLGLDARPRHRAVLARNRETGEVKYFVTSAPPAVGVKAVLTAAFCRWHVEHVFRVAKSEVGLTHYEGRHYLGLTRHLVLCLLVLGFVALHTERLRGEKPGRHAGASVPGPERPMHRPAPAGARDG